MCIARPSAWPNVLRQQSVKDIQRMSIAPLWMEVSAKTPERFIEEGIIDHWHHHPELSYAADFLACLTPGISCERPICSTLVSFIPLFDVAMITQAGLDEEVEERAQVFGGLQSGKKRDVLVAHAPDLLG